MSSFSVRDFSIGLALGVGALAAASSISNALFSKNPKALGADRTSEAVPTMAGEEVTTLREPNLRDSDELRDRGIERACRCNNGRHAIGHPQRG